MALEDCPWIMAAISQSQIGLREIKKSQNGFELTPRIQAWLQAAGEQRVDASHMAWCGAFAHFALSCVGIKCPVLASNAQVWRDWGQALAVPRWGCVAVFRLSREGEENHWYHVGFYVGEYTHPSGKRLKVLGGNQSHSVKISPLPDLGGTMQWDKGTLRTDEVSFRWPPVSKRLSREELMQMARQLTTKI